MIELQFNFPAALYLTLFSLLILALFWHLNRYRKTALESLANPKVQNLERAKFTFWVKTLFLCSVWILASLALMQPKGNGRYSETGQKNLSDVTIQRKAHEVIFFVDTSASMDVKDARSGETRLSFAKEIIDEVMSQLSGEDVSLYAFTSEVSKRVPPTMDYLFARIALHTFKRTI
jgi:Ca-activated chloride channel homolog